MIKSQFKIIQLLIISVFLFKSINSYAQPKSFYEMSLLEVGMLPPFCQSWYKGYRQPASGQGKQEFKAWGEKLGGIPDPQHLCPGLNALNYSYSQSKGTPGHAYAVQVATNELSYVLKRNKSFPIRSTVLLKRGKGYEEWRKMDKAMRDYREAIQIKPKNTRAYVSTAELYLKLKNRKEARNIIDQGLKVNPNSKTLLRWGKKLR